MPPRSPQHCRERRRARSPVDPRDCGRRRFGDVLLVGVRCLRAHAHPDLVDVIATEDDRCPAQRIAPDLRRDDAVDDVDAADSYRFGRKSNPSSVAAPDEEHGPYLDVGPTQLGYRNSDVAGAALQPINMIKKPSIGFVQPPSLGAPFGLGNHCASRPDQQMIYIGEAIEDVVDQLPPVLTERTQLGRRPRLRDRSHRLGPAAGEQKDGERQPAEHEDDPRANHSAAQEHVRGKNGRNGRHERAEQSTDREEAPVAADVVPLCSANLIPNPTAGPSVTSQPPLSRLFSYLLKHGVIMRSRMVSINYPARRVARRTPSTRDEPGRSHH
jgi:hypothetical protein